MSLTYGFFNSVDGDRMYNAIQVSSIFDGIIEDGIFGSIGDAFQVLATTGLGTSIGTGRAWFNHTWTYNDSVIPIVLDGSDPILPRYDAIILEVDESVGVRANSIKKVTGTPATTPTYPTLTNTAYVHQYPFAYILVNGGATSITQASITNMIGQTACPFVTGPLSVISTNDLVAQWEEEFNLWFDQMQDQLSEDAAGNLQIQINTHNHGEVTSTPVIAAGIANGAVDYTKVGSRIPTLLYRQGSSATDWAEAGSPTQIPETVRIQVGSMHWGSGTPESSGTIDVTYPMPYSQPPLVFVQYVGADTQKNFCDGVRVADRLGFTYEWKTSGLNGDITSLDFSWFAIGPELSAY